MYIDEIGDADSTNWDYQVQSMLDPDSFPFPLDYCPSLETTNLNHGAQGPASNQLINAINFQADDIQPDMLAGLPPHMSTGGESTEPSLYAHQHGQSSPDTFYEVPVNSGFLV